MSASIHYGITEPSNPPAGTAWFNPATRLLKVRNGDAWETKEPELTELPASHRRTMALNERGHIEIDGVEVDCEIAVEGPTVTRRGKYLRVDVPFMVKGYSMSEAPEGWHPDMYTDETPR